jgi:methionyl-tRNA formyltransferase
MERIRELQPDLLFVCDYGQILSRECLAVARLGGINLHGSLLPRHRGAAPVQWTILSGDEQAGVTVIHMTAKLDAGPALAIRSTAILPDETAQDLEPRLSELGVSATAEAVQLLFDWDGESPLGRLQQAGLVTKAPRFHKQQGQLDFRLPSDYLVRLIRACQPWPSTFAELVDGNGKKVRLLIRCARSLDRSLNSDGPEGQVAIVDPGLQGIDWPQVGKQAFLVKCGRGSMLIGRVRPSGKRDMEVAEFLRGHPIDAGAYFALPDPPSVRLA